MKRVYRSNENKTILGICGGIAEYFDIDPILIRLIFLVFFFISPVTLVAYAIAYLLIPKKR
jgi:phage shock protein C